MLLGRDSMRFAFKLDELSIIQDDKRLSALAEKYQPKEGLNYVSFVYHATAPEINMKGMAITAPTMANSLQSAIHHFVDYEHRAEDLDIPRYEDEDYGTDVMGSIVELEMGEMPDPDDKDAWILRPYIPKQALLTRGVMAMYSRIFRVNRIAQEIGIGSSWWFSLEIGNKCTDPAIWLKANDEKPDEIMEWAEAPQELRTLASQPEMTEYEGRQVAYLMGGKAGNISLIGGAITKNPAGYEQRQPGNSLMLVASADGTIQDTAVDKVWQSEKWKKDIKTCLKERKEAQKSASDDGESGNIVPVYIANLDEALEFAEVITELKTVEVDDDTGGENTVAEVELTQKEFDTKIAEATTKGKEEGDKEGYERGKTEGADQAVASAIEAGTHIAVDDLEDSEHVAAIVARKSMKDKRETQVASLKCDEDVKADFKALASDETRYPLDEEGQKKFDASFEKWKASMKTASEEEEEEEEEEADPNGEMRNASNTYDPGSGGGGGDEDILDILQ